MWACACEYHAHRDQKCQVPWSWRAVVSCLIWTLGTEFSSYRRIGRLISSPEMIFLAVIRRAETLNIPPHVFRSDPVT